MKRLVLATLLAGTAIAPALAQEHEHRQAGTHVHGLAELAVALNPDGTLVAELESPLYNLIGFERAPRDAAEGQAVAQALAHLNEDAVVAFNAEARCAAGETVTDGFPYAHTDDEPADDHEPMHHDGEDDHAHDHDAHGHDHDAPEGDEAEHEHDHFGDHSEAETPSAGDTDDAMSAENGSEARRYSDAFVSWTFACEAPERLTRVDVRVLFESFERLEEVNVQFFDGRRSASDTLTPSAPALSIRQ